MRFEGLDLNLLVVLDALLDEKSVTKASVKLNVSQPAISAALAKLRWHVNDDILHKVGKTVQLTPRGEQMISPVKDILYKIRSTFSEEYSFNPNQSDRTFKIAMSSFACQYISPKLTKAVIENFPNIRYFVEPLSVDSIKRVKNGDVDICVSADQINLLNPKENLDDLSLSPFFNDKFVLISDILNKLETPICTSDFISLPYVETHIGPHTVTIADDAMRQLGITPRSVVYTPDFHLTVENVIGTACVAIVPSRMINDRMKKFVRIYDVPFEVSDLNETLLWHSRNDAEPGHKWFREMILDLATAE
ncbi:LysR family transcriptional regulator, nod-box dependent transcriptional activator [Sphingobium faniae]|nr:LysR family transcriptional regulator, nod-box dependent transcriptional activator [Sphingobium faniae]